MRYRMMLVVIYEQNFLIYLSELESKRRLHSAMPRLPHARYRSQRSIGIFLMTSLTLRSPRHAADDRISEMTQEHMSTITHLMLNREKILPQCLVEPERRNYSKSIAFALKRDHVQRLESF